jgi:hypothetical protein
VPGKTGTKNLSAYPESGIKLRIVTNSLAATDVSAVHSGYAKRRMALLRSGTRLYELKPDAPKDGAPAAGHPKGGAGLPVERIATRSPPQPASATSPRPRRAGVSGARAFATWQPSPAGGNRELPGRTPWPPAHRGCSPAPGGARPPAFQHWREASAGRYRLAPASNGQAHPAESRLTAPGA